MPEVLDASHPAAVPRAVDVLRRGGLVAVPTETVYGLGADAANPRAVERVFAVKGRPRGHPLIVHVRGASSLPLWATGIPPSAELLADRFWPGPLTMVLHRRLDVDPTVTGGRGTIALRAPAHPLTIALLEAFGGGIAAPSANHFGRVSPTCAADVVADLGDDIDLVLDGGTCRVGVESTIVDLTVTPPALLRPGGISAADLEWVLGGQVLSVAGGEVRAPGMHSAHYAPSARVQVVEQADLAGECERLTRAGLRVGALGALGGGDVPSGVEVLAVPGDAEVYARVLYTRLREADRLALDVVLAVLPAESGVGAAVADRLRRAAAAAGKGP